MSRLIMNMILVKCQFVPIIMYPGITRKYKDSVRDYQVKKMAGQYENCRLLWNVANEVLGYFEEILDEV